MLFDTIARLVAERVDCDAATITPDSRFEELGIDSLDTMEVLMELEGEIGHEVELNEKVETVAELIKVIESQIEA